jgi:hypothetical protein
MTAVRRRNSLESSGKCQCESSSICTPLGPVASDEMAIANKHFSLERKPPTGQPRPLTATLLRLGCHA